MSRTGIVERNVTIHFTCTTVVNEKMPDDGLFKVTVVRVSDLTLSFRFTD